MVERVCEARFNCPVEIENMNTGSTYTLDAKVTVDDEYNVELWLQVIGFRTTIFQASPKTTHVLKELKRQHYIHISCLLDDHLRASKQDSSDLMGKWVELVGKYITIRKREFAKMMAKKEECP